MRSLLKSVAFLVSAVAVSPLVVMSKLEERVFGSETERVYGACKEVLALVPTAAGNYLRRAYYWGSCRGVAMDASINFGAMIAHRNTIIGKGTVIGSFSIIGSAVIGRDVLIAPKVSILSGKYPHGHPADRGPHGKGESRFEMITIGDGSLIGQGAIVLVDVGRNCTVGAGSVVNRAVPDGVTVMGNPARRVSLESGDAAGPVRGAAGGSEGRQ